MKLISSIKNNKKLLIISIIGLLCLITGIVYFLIYITTKIEVKLIGDDTISLSVNNDYKDEGFIILKNNKKVNKKIKYEVKDNVNNKLLGDYTYKYHIKYRNKEYELIRKVQVVDNEAPKININVTSVNRDYCTKKITTKYEYSAIDNYEKDITSKVNVIEKGNILEISVSDSSKNETKMSIPIQDSEKPKDVLKLIGKSTIYIPLNGTYTESGVTYTDGCGTNLDPVIEGNVDTTKLGEQIITYYSADKKNSIKRKVIIYDQSQVIYTPNGTGKVLYLTFDEGPSIYTQQVLNILAKYNVKATFFVTNQFPAYSYLIGVEHNEGHAVGVHSYTHQWNIYYSVDNYVNDFNNMNSIITSYTGSPSKIFRFPGGSSNTVSTKYASGVVSAIASHMTGLGYVYFDWDISSGDAGGASEAQIYNNVVNGAAKCKSCVFLMHDIKKKTVNQLDNILNTLISQGYQFGVLTPSSPTAHQKIVN